MNDGTSLMRDEKNTAIKVKCLGQAGFRFEFDQTVIYIDPYLSNSVQEHEGDDLPRLKPIPMPPERITDADWIFVTHEHRDHCDPDTLVPISRASPDCKFHGPPNALQILEEVGISAGRLEVAEPGAEKSLARDAGVYTVPAAHPNVERDAVGAYRWVGYVFRFGDRFVYHAGDTLVSAEVLAALRAVPRIDVAILPVNERNHYRDRRGIIGNMSVREAFGFAEDIGAAAVVPMHWDMFEKNAVFREEIELVYRKTAPGFRLLIEPEAV